MTSYLVVTESAWEEPQKYVTESYEAAQEIADYLRSQQYRVKIKQINDLDDR